MTYGKTKYKGVYRIVVDADGNVTQKAKRISKEPFNQPYRPLTQESLYKALAPAIVISSKINSSLQG